MEEEDYYGVTPEFAGISAHNPGGHNSTIPSSPSASESSDKENTSQPSSQKHPPRVLYSDDRINKRKRMEDQVDSQQRGNRRSTRDRQSTDLQRAAMQFYDPDQDVEERRVLRKKYRDLSKNLNDNRSEYLNPSSRGLLETLLQANELSASVKQTADATIESRLLVTTADLSYRKTVQLTQGSSAQGIDVDEFVSKCRTFMQRGDPASRTAVNSRGSTQYRRNAALEGDDDEDDEGDMLNWEHLGRKACLVHNYRPAASGHLLGPLSLEKKARKVAQRKAPLRLTSLQQTQPEVLQASDIEKSENSNVTYQCSKILSRLKEVQRKASEAVEADLEEYMTDEQTRQLMEKHGIRETGALDLFKFVVNPNSFGQTIENIFYVTFLIRDGKAGISIDDSGMPLLEPIKPRMRGEVSQQSIARCQAVLALDYDTWKEIIELFDIREPMIPHRKDEDHSQIGVRGWYG